MRLNRRAGFTTIETLIVLAILGLIITGVVAFGAGLYGQISKEAFDEEAEVLCRFFNDSRKIAMMTDEVVEMDIHEDYVVRYAVNEEKKLSLKHLTLSDIDGHTTDDVGRGLSQSFVSFIRFKSAGTILTGTTYRLKGSGDNLCYLIIQPVTGRMYLSDEKPKNQIK